MHPSPHPAAHAAVADAAERIRGHVRRTPLLRTSYAGVDLVLKLEHLQLTGSFKVRGALNALLQLGRDARGGVVAASGGNHGLGVAYAGRKLGVPTKIVVPATVPAAKAAMLDRLGAQLVRYGERYADAESHARDLATALSLPFVHPFQDARVIAGQGTLADEVLADVGSEIDAIVVGVGGGGLLAGTCAAVAGRDGSAVWGIEPEGAATVTTAASVGRPVPVEVDTVASSSLGARMTGEVNLRLIADAHLGLVSDAQILAAQRALWDDFRILVEPGGAVAMAGVLAGIVDAQAPCVVLCGANTTVDLDAAR